MKIDINNKDNIKEIFESYGIKGKGDIFEVSFDDKQILEEILNIFPGIEYSNEGTESDKLWDIYHQIDNIEIDIMLGRNQGNGGFIID